MKMCKQLEDIQGLSANELLKKYNCANKVPVDINKLLSNIGVRVYNVDLQPLASDKEFKKAYKGYGELYGAVLARENDLNIFYQDIDFSKLSSREKISAKKHIRFTLAHELAHCVLHANHVETGYAEFRCDTSKLDPKKLKKGSYEAIEYEANVYAGELLIPTDKLVYVYFRLVRPSLAALAELFFVSTNVMRARLDYLHMPYDDDVNWYRPAFRRYYAE